MSGLGPVVALLWKELGMAPPPERIGNEFDFELGEMAVSLSLQEDGDTVLVRGLIGHLEGNVHEAGDQLGRVLRLGLALTALNGAALDAAEAETILERDHEGTVPVHALAVVSLARPTGILTAMRSLLDWQTATGSILLQASGDGDPAAAARHGEVSGGEQDGGMIIFQP